MPIDLGLRRVTQLLKLLKYPQQSYDSIHIAGTNGKGSVCSYISSSLISSKVKTGKFTSPHLIRRSDCIAIDDVPISHEEFLKEEKQVLQIDAHHNLHCTEFELLACTAFSLFKKHQVDIAVVEVGLGGRLDATNVLEQASPLFKKGVIATGITKIGLDHEGILGSTLKEIAYQKAGIIKPNVPCIVDGTNEPECLEVFQEVAAENHAHLYVMSEPRKTRTTLGNIECIDIPLAGQYQFANLSVALKILESVSVKYPSITGDTVRKGISAVKWPGRLQSINLKYDPLLPSMKVLIDGAHNGSAAIELSRHIAANVRYGDEPVTFLIAVTKGKNVIPLLSPLIKKQDTVIVTKFGAVDGMPWIECNDSDELAQIVKDFTDKVTVQNDLKMALDAASQTGSKVVICGSLYLVGEILLMARDQASGGSM